MNDINLSVITEFSSDLLSSLLLNKLKKFGYDENTKFYSHLNSPDKIREVLDTLNGNKEDTVVLYVLQDKKLIDYAWNYCRDKEISCYNILDITAHFFDDIISGLTVDSPNIENYLPYNIRSEYLTFARENDDGKRLENLQEADIILLGISRTGKTPLSIYLSNSKLKVVNIPIVPEARLPSDLWKLDKTKVFGLTMNVERLSLLRRERLKSLGLPGNAEYASPKRIKEELDFSKHIMDQMECKLIDVSNLSIEETADIIHHHLKNGKSKGGRADE